MSEKIYLTVSNRYCQHWTIWLALREILQNTLDCENRNIDVLDEGAGGEQRILFETFGSKLEKSSLMMGETTKDDDSSTLGKFGEGYKLAALVLIRNGMDVHVINGYDKWIFTIEEHPVMGVNCLTVTITEDFYDFEPDKRTEVSFIVSGLSSDDIKEFEDNTFENRLLNIVAEGDEGKAFKAENMPQGLFINGVKIMSLFSDWQYSFDVTSEYAERRFTMGRDREHVMESELETLTGQLLANNADYETLVELIVKNATPVDSSSSCDFNGPLFDRLEDEGDAELQRFKTMLTDAFIEKHGDKTIPVEYSYNSRIKRQFAMEKMAEQGYESKSIRSGAERLFDMTRFPDFYSDFESIEELPGTVTESLEEFFLKNQKLMRKSVREKFSVLLRRIQLHS